MSRTILDDRCFDDRYDERVRRNWKYLEATDRERTIADAFPLRAFSQHILPLFPRGGKALDLAGGGARRHALWLAKRGWERTLIDISDAGVEQARQNAGRFASVIDFDFVVDDLTAFKASQTQRLGAVVARFDRFASFCEVLRSREARDLAAFN